MKQIKFLFLLTSLLSAVLGFSCDSSSGEANCERYSEELGLSHLLKQNTQNCCSEPLCSLIESSLQGNQKSLLEIMQIETWNATSYDHGVLLVNLLRKLGEPHFVKTIYPLSFYERQRILSLLEVGLEYDQQEDAYLGLERAFPTLYKTLIEHRNY